MAGYPVVGVSASCTHDPQGVDIYDEEGNLTHYDLGDTVPLSKLISRRYNWLVNRGYLSEVETDDWGSTVWGEISGTLSSQTDLQNALDAKLNLTGGTLTGLLTITSGANTFGFKNGGSSVTPQFHLGTSGGKSVGLLAGTSGTAFVYDSTGTFNITTDTKANIDNGTSSGGTARLTMSSTGAMTLTSDLTLSLGNLAISAGYVSLGSVLGDRLMMYGAKDGAYSYGLGVEAGALYYRANGTHRWYTGTVADSGTSAVMSLASTGLTLTGQTYIKNSTPTSLQAIKGSRFGYSTGYRTVVIGDTGTANFTSVAIAEDVSDIVTGSGWSGDGREVIFRNAAKFMTPNSGRTGFIQALKWDSVGKTTLLALDVTTGDASGNLLKVFGEGATNGMAISTNWNTGNAYLDFRLGGTTTAYNTLRLNNGGVVQLPGTTDSTTTTTGALQVAGGVGIAKALYVGTTLNVTGQTTLTGNVISNVSIVKANAAFQMASSSGAATIYFDRPAGNSGQLQFRSGSSAAGLRWNVLVNSTAESGSNAGSDFAIQAVSDAGALLMTALSIARSTGDVVLASTTDSSSSTTGAIKTAGGMGIAKKLYVGTDANVAGTIEASDVRAISQVMGVF